jgi:hypothetical protein
MTKLFFVLALAGCLDSQPKAGDPAPQSGVADFAPFESDDDCASGLDGCYKTCQAHQPSPIEGCFKDCDVVFYGCIGLLQ